MTDFICRVDAADRIAFVNANWTQFAVENGLAQLTAKEVAGVSLWRYVSDSATRHLYGIFMQRVRQTGRSVTVPFRCDAPDRRRFMRMTIRPLAEGGLEFHSELLREEPRSKVSLLDQAIPRGTDMLEMCSWCKKVKAPDWVEAEEGVARLKLFDTPQLPQVTHGICPDCSQVLRQELKRPA